MSVENTLEQVNEALRFAGDTPNFQRGRLYHYSLRDILQAQAVRARLETLLNRKGTLGESERLEAFAWAFRVTKDVDDADVSTALSAKMTSEELTRFRELESVSIADWQRSSTGYFYKELSVQGGLPEAKRMQIDQSGWIRNGYLTGFELPRNAISTRTWSKYSGGVIVHNSADEPQPVSTDQVRDESSDSPRFKPEFTLIGDGAMLGRPSAEGDSAKKEFDKPGQLNVNGGEATQKPAFDFSKLSEAQLRKLVLRGNLSTISIAGVNMPCLDVVHQGAQVTLVEVVNFQQNHVDHFVGDWGKRTRIEARVNYSSAEQLAQEALAKGYTPLESVLIANLYFMRDRKLDLDYRVEVRKAIANVALDDFRFSLVTSRGPGYTTRESKVGVAVFGLLANLLVDIPEADLGMFTKRLELLRGRRIEAQERQSRKIQAASEPFVRDIEYDILHYQTQAGVGKNNRLVTHERGITGIPSYGGELSLLGRPVYALLGPNKYRLISWDRYVAADAMAIKAVEKTGDRDIATMAASRYLAYDIKSRLHMYFVRMGWLPVPSSKNQLVVLEDRLVNGENSKEKIFLGDFSFGMQDLPNKVITKRSAGEVGNAVWDATSKAISRAWRRLKFMRRTISYDLAESGSTVDAGLRRLGYWFRRNETATLKDLGKRVQSRKHTTGLK